MFFPLRKPGGVTEWLKVTVLKTVVAQATAGSNPVPSAKNGKKNQVSIVKYQDPFYFLLFAAIPKTQNSRL